MLAQQSPIFSLGETTYHDTNLYRGKFRLLLTCSCSRFVEYVYECLNLDIVDRTITRDPKQPNRTYPATQVHAFSTGQYPLSAQWDNRMASYPECLEIGPRTSIR
jgi:hypothetical protein